VNTAKSEDLVADLLADLLAFSPSLPAPSKDVANLVKYGKDILGKCTTRESFLRLYQGLKYQFGIEGERKESDHTIAIEPILDALKRIK
jgi:hypothetical protein